MSLFPQDYRLKAEKEIVMISIKDFDILLTVHLNIFILILTNLMH